MCTISLLQPPVSLSLTSRAVAVRPSGEACQLAGQVSRAGSYVVTGGTGGIGLDLALRFARAGAGGVVLLSRCGWFTLHDVTRRVSR